MTAATDSRVRQVDDCPIADAGVDCGGVEWWVSEDGEWLFERLGDLWQVVRRGRGNRVFDAGSLDEAVAWALDGVR